MAGGKTWTLPALLAAAQLGLWPGLVLARGDIVDPIRVAAVVAVVLVVAAALGRRRRAPAVVTAVVATGLSVGTWITRGDQLFAPGDALIVISVADYVALFSVSVLCSRRTTGVVLAALVLSEAVRSAGLNGFTADYPWELLASVGVYAIVAACGRIRRRWLADRSAAARRLADAEQARREAAAVERRRLARELHDVTAHHLTSIVVNASAAQYLGDQRPELRAEALAFAARAGRETMADVRRLVACLPFDEEASAASRLAELADDLRQLGHEVTLDTIGDPPPEIAEAVHGIAREALTNTLRYAPGSVVRLHFSYGHEGARLVVEDTGGPPARPPAVGLGGGRGLAGMRERAAALGGTLHAGPHGEGGWRVRAELPAPSMSPDLGRRWRRWLRSQLVLDAGVASLALIPPVSATAAAVAEGLTPARSTLLLVAVLARAAPLLWRRQRPWTALAAVSLTTWLSLLLIVTGIAPSDAWWLLPSGLGADFAAVYAVAAYGARPRLTWLAPAGAALSTPLALAALVAIDPPNDAPLVTHDTLMVVALLASLAVLTALAALVLVLPAAGSWLAGHTARRRRQRRLDREERAVVVAAWQATWRTHQERARVAAGLRAVVLEHAARVPTAAEAADLTAVLACAREALAAMRALLDGLNTRPVQAGADRLGGPADRPLGADLEEEVSSSPSE